MKQIKQNKKSITLATALLLAIVAISISAIYWLKRDNELTPEPKNEMVSEFTPEERKMRDEVISQIIEENNKNTSYFKLSKSDFDKRYEFTINTLNYDRDIAISSVNSGIVLNVAGNIGRFSELLNEKINYGPYNPKTSKIYDFLRCDELQRIIPEAEVVRNGHVCEVKVNDWEYISEIRYAYNKQLTCFEVSNKEYGAYETGLIDMTRRLYDYHKVFSFLEKPFSDECIKNSILENK